MRIRVPILVCLMTLGLAGCGGSGGGGVTRAEMTKALAGAPPALAGLHRQASDLVDGGVPALRGRLAALRGHPVVVNIWAAWCEPCRAESGLLARAALKVGKRVGFLGVDSKDRTDVARTFLSRHLLPYPSYADPSGAFAKSLNATIGLPITAFYDARGRLVFRHPGAYGNEKTLLADIERYT